MFATNATREQSLSAIKQLKNPRYCEWNNH